MPTTVIRYGLTRDWIAGLKVVTGSVRSCVGLASEEHELLPFQHLLGGLRGNPGPGRSCTVDPWTVMVLGVPRVGDLLSNHEAAPRLSRLPFNFRFFLECGTRKVNIAHHGQFQNTCAGGFDASVTKPQKLHVWNPAGANDGVNQSIRSSGSCVVSSCEVSEAIIYHTPYKNSLSVPLSASST